MSRTKKDRPTWVRANDPATPNRYVQHNHTRTGCTLDDFAVQDSRGRRWPQCHWDLPYADAQDGPARLDTHTQYWGPLRAAVRVALAELALEHNLHGDITDDRAPAPTQHREGVKQWWS